MVTMLVPCTEKIPLFTDFLGEKHPYFSQNEGFWCKKNQPFFWFQREHIAWWPLLKQIEDIHYSCNTFFVWFCSCLLLVVVTLEHYISWKCKATSWFKFAVQCKLGPPKTYPFVPYHGVEMKKVPFFSTFQGPCMELEIPPFLRVSRNEHESNSSY